MATIEELTETIVKFRDERDWAQFHNAKDLSLAFSGNHRKRQMLKK